MAYRKRLFTVVGHRKTEENYENKSARRDGCVSNTESGEPPKNKFIALLLHPPATV